MKAYTVQHRLFYERGDCKNTRARYIYGRGMKMNRRNLTKFVDIRSEVEELKNRSHSFFELLDLMDFRDDLRYK